MMNTRLKRLFPSLLLLALSLCTVAAAQEGRSAAQDLISRGNELYARAEYEAAIALYARVPAPAGDAYAQALYNIGVCRYELQQTAEAALLYAKAIEARRGRYAVQERITPESLAPPTPTPTPTPQKKRRRRPRG